MKELTPKIIDKVKQFDQREIEKQQKKVGSLKVHPGQSCFQYVMDTNEVLVADYERNAIMVQDERGKDAIVVQRKIIMKPGSLYVVALNRNNAMKKFIKLIDKMIKK